VQGKVIQLSGQRAGFPAFPIGSVEEEGEKILEEERWFFAGGFAIFGCFVVVKTWRICGGMRRNCGVLHGVSAAKKHANFFNFIFGLSATKAALSRLS
jgi:hypothetical protein